MLCEVQFTGNFFLSYLAMTSIGVASIVLISGIVFWRYYVHPSYETWRYKSNPIYPSPKIVIEDAYFGRESPFFGEIVSFGGVVCLVRNEIIQMMKGVFTATLCPVIALWLSHRGLSQGYCGSGGYSVGYHVFQFMAIWLGSDWFEFYYHRLGHTTDQGWSQHKYHHLFPNPSPFAVIADEYVDQFFRSIPLLIFPMIMPTNIDLLFFQFAVFFYGYGCYLHWGFETSYPDAHHPIINTAYQHYLHHAKSIKNIPYNTGFFFKCWDQLFGSLYTGPCECSKCCREKGLRTKQQYDKIEKPNYGLLLSPSFWFEK